MQNKAAGARIAQRLEEMQRDKKWLARQVGKSPSLISRWVEGSRKMSAQELRDVALVLHMGPSGLFDAAFETADEIEQEKVA
jgi:transcriptional regulator with XRE-family HTH domain